MDETQRRNHRRIPKRRWLAQTGSQHKDSARRMILHVRENAVVSAHARHPDEQRMVLRKNALRAWGAHDRSAQPFRQLADRPCGSARSVSHPQGDRAFHQQRRALFSQRVSRASWRGCRQDYWRRSRYVVGLNRSGDRQMADKAARPRQTIGDPPENLRQHFSGFNDRSQVEQWTGRHQTRRHRIVVSFLDRPSATVTRGGAGRHQDDFRALAARR